MQFVDIHFYYSKSNRSHMFRLRKTAIVRPYVSENVKRKLYSCIHTLHYHMYGYSYTVAYRVGGGLGCSNRPPPEILKALHNRAKLNTICENC